ncbi:Transketolase, central region [Trichormus variabilis ATCC 29413]|uniref:Transketolase, central region n=2 Tax=Anabaena variabilis TaxID=264691 RepID=Q3M573_TRIV2|nr:MULTISPECIES: phosphoketolase [Nostocaceae]ABA23863.1 Transketolase, central region [Trichormus variabilis ATCC 29413]MBC1214457.1 phosphoketolase [Trichormus variabilis ARAD]MBC1256496.1 phosphoketolase [Trichormus variabilis V5]MBC1269951.1 phosphoketolase [Trichormus variabilis FSR]MBC1300435.1 phosphoketolase [Trichormus variabilis N2B]
MTAITPKASSALPEFAEGIQYFGEALPDFETYGATPAIESGKVAIAAPTNPQAVYQTLLAADALRYLTLQITGSKASGHPGGFASQAEAYAALVMLGYKNIITEVGHHAPGFYSAMFLDRSLEDMGISTVQQLRDRFREKHGLLGHLSGYIPGILAPAGPLGQGQHFAMAAALLHRDKLFPFTLGDGGLGEPYIMSSMAHFNTAYPSVTNFLPVLVWNGYSQEHHSMVSLKTNAQMTAYWQGNGFEEVVLVDAKEFDDQNQPGDYVDSTIFSFTQRLAFTQAVLVAVDKAARSALGGKLTVFIIKQLKGAGVHAKGAKSHNLYPKDTLDAPHIITALQKRALSPAAWQTVRTNAERAGGGPASKTVVTEFELPLPDLGTLPLEEYAVGGEPKVSTTAMGRIVGAVGQKDPNFLVTNADGNEASGIGNINQALKIIHPTTDDLYNQAPNGQVYEPLSEDACAGLAVGLSLMGARTLWCSYESFAINGLPIWQTVIQAMAELRRPTPSTITLFTAGALEQGRNGWTHQRPEIEAYFASMMRNGNVFPVFPPDANSTQVCYDWALTTKNKGIVITASKSPLPIRTTFAQTRQGLEEGAVVLHEIPGGKQVVFAVIGDMTLIPVFEAAAFLETEGIGVKIVSVINPRRLYRPHDVAWDTCSEADNGFIDDAKFAELFAGDALIGVTGGVASMLEPIMLRSNSKRDTFAWKRGETTASAGELMAFNGLTAEALTKRAIELVH